MISKDLEKSIHKLVDEKIVSYPLIWYMKKKDKEDRAMLINKIAEYTLGTGFAFSIITFIFRKEIEELINDVKKVTKESLLKLVELFERFKSRRKL